MMVLAALAAFLVSLAVVMLVERRATVLGLIDVPNDRSSHAQPRPRGGGLGVFSGVGAGLIVAIVLGVAFGSPIWIVLVGAILVAGAGLWDDIAKLGVAPRLVVQTTAAAIVVWQLGGFDQLPLPVPLDLPLGPTGTILTVVWIVAVTNFFNFMDGVDGLAGGQACLAFGALAWALWPSPIAVLSLVAASATGGFLVRNWAPARIFLGDVGSGLIGFVLASAPLTAPMPARASLTLLVGTSIALFLLDPVTTLGRHYAEGRRVGSAHRDHLYQQLIGPDESHAPGVTMLLVAAASLTGAALVAYQYPAFGWVGVLWAVLVCGIETVAARARRRAAGGTP